MSNIPGMSDRQFTPRAAVLWGMIPKEARLGAITNFTGEEEKGDVILKGACAKCRHEVVRVVETSERDSSGN